MNRVPPDPPTVTLARPDLLVLLAKLDLLVLQTVPQAPLAGLVRQASLDPPARLALLVS